jgi:hypothetical protein
MRPTSWSTRSRRRRMFGTVRLNAQAAVQIACEILSASALRFCGSVRADIHPFQRLGIFTASAAARLTRTLDRSMGDWLSAIRGRADVASANPSVAIDRATLGKIVSSDDPEAAIKQSGKITLLLLCGCPRSELERTILLSIANSRYGLERTSFRSQHQITSYLCSQLPRRFSQRVEVRS